MSNQEILDRLRHVRLGATGWTALCPAHPDRHPSLSIRVYRGLLRFHCFTGCSEAAVRNALQLTPLSRVSDTGKLPARPDWAWAVIRREAAAIYREQPAAYLAKRYRKADQLRALDAEITAARADAMQLGDTDEAWELLAEAALAEGNLHRMEAEP